MSDPSASAEPARADSGSPPADDSSRSGEAGRNTGARVAALIVGVLIGIGIGMGIGMGIGNAARKRIDRWSPQY